jgi:threonyl-tRNA synthetase
MNIAITLPDGSVREMPAGSSPADIAASIGRGLARDAVAAVVDGATVDVGTALNADAEVSIITIGSPEGVEIMRHSTSHVLAAAVGRLYGDVKFGIGPAITDGFYYDFDLDAAISSDDLEKIEAEMAKIVAADEPFVREDVLRADAIELMRSTGQLYKVELLEELEVEQVSLYRTGDFMDLCLGPHLPSTGKLGVVKLLSVAGAYWRGDSDRPQLQRIYGTVWSTKKELKKHLHRLAEAEKRDHRRLGKELDLFSMDEEIGQGLVLWHPNGTLIRSAIEDFWKAEHAARGYQMVVTPHIASEKVYLRSGHIPKYEEMMYAPLEIDEQRYRLKPMNCPAHIKIFQSRARSYRDLPIRYGELGTVYRYEMSGALQGMLRVRGFTQDDAHIFCTPEQLVSEITDLLELIDEMLHAFGYTYKVYLSTRPKVSLETASDAEWEHATESLRGAMSARGLAFEVDEGAGTFYAPKIDVKLCDALGREWQGPTIQVDLNLPKRFNVEYVDSKGRQRECVMVHRTILGSMERFVGGLIEHFGGWFPVWLAPEAARVLPITNHHNDYANEVAEKLRSAGVRTGVALRNETMGHKIRSGVMDKVPYLLVVGDCEVEAGTVNVRSHDNGQEGVMDVDALVERLKEEIATKKLPKGFGE